MKTPNDALVGIDVGSHKVLCVIARPMVEKGAYRVEGYGIVPSEGVRKGVVADLEAVVTNVREAVREAQASADMRATATIRAWAAIGGQDLTSETCVGTTVLRGKEVTQNDVNAAEATARANCARSDRKLIKFCTQGYYCGDAFTTASPIGLTGDRLEARIHAVYGSVRNAENMLRCLQRSGLGIAGYEPHPWASAKAVLSPTDRYCGTVVIDIGAETSSVAMYYENILCYTAERPFGAEFFTRDVATIFGITLEEAEEIKTTVGCCSPQKVPDGETVQPLTTARNGRTYPRQLLARTLRDRAEEFFRLYRNSLQAAGWLDKVHCVVLTGGGASLVDIDEVARTVFDMPVRVCGPRALEGGTNLLSLPQASAAVGLILSAGEKLAAEEDLGYRTRTLPSFFGRFGKFETLKNIVIGDY